MGFNMEGRVRGRPVSWVLGEGTCHCLRDKSTTGLDMEEED